MQVSGQAEQPRVLLVSAPYALKAGDAETIGGLPPSAFLLARPQASQGLPHGSNKAAAAGGSPSSVTGSGVTNFVPLWTSSSNLGISELYQLNGEVGVGTTTPGGKLDVLTGSLIATRSTSLTAGGTGLYGISSAMTGAGVGVTGEAHSATGVAGVFNNVAGGKVLSGQKNGTEVFSVNATGVVTGSSFQIGSNLFAFGTYANQNAFLGFAGNSTMSGGLNTATGVGALNSDTTGGTNTAIGAFALHSNGGGSANTATGYQALSNNTWGNQNTATGVLALFANNGGSANTAIGSSALNFNTNGQNNTANGFEALLYNANGSDNTAIGMEALSSNNGNSNTAVGYNAGFNVTTGSYNIEIGNYGTTSDNGTIRIGTAGNQTSAFIAGIYGASTSANNAVPVLIDSNGNLGTVSSSRRYKEDIQNMGDASAGLMRLRPVTFRYKKPFADGSQPMQYGLIAEEVAEVYPDLVARSADGQIETVKYQLLDPMLLNEVQRQEAEIRELQERLSKMEAALAAVSHAAESK